MAPRKNYVIPGVAPRRSGRIRARTGDGASTGASSASPPQASQPPPAAPATAAAAAPAQPKKAPAKKKPAAKKPVPKKTPAPKKAKASAKKSAKAASKSPSKTPVQTPVPIPVQTPVPIPVQTPVQTPVPIPVQTPVPVPVQISVQTPSQKSRTPLLPPSTGSGTGWRPSKVTKSRSSSAKSTQSGSSKVQKRLTVSQMAVLQAQFDAQQAQQQAQAQAAAAAQPHIQGQLQASAPPAANVQPPSSPTSASTAELERRHTMSSPPLESRGAFYQAQAQQAARVQARIAQQQAQAQAQAQALAQAQASAQNPPSTPTSGATSEIEARLAAQGEPRSPRRSSPRSAGRRSSGRRSPETPTPAPRIRPAPANPVSSGSPVANAASVPNAAGAQAATNAGAGAGTNANANANVQTSPAAAEASVNMDMSSLFPTSPVEPSPAVNSSPPGPAKVNAQLTVPFPLPAGPLLYPTPPPSAARTASQAPRQPIRAATTAAQAQPAQQLTMSTPIFVDVPATADRDDGDGGEAGTAGATPSPSQTASVPPAVPGVTAAAAATPNPPTQLPDIQEADEDPVIETIRGTPPRQLPRATLNALLNANLRPASGTDNNTGAAQPQKSQKSQKRKRRGTQSDECGDSVEEDEEDPKYPGVKKMRRPQLRVADGGRDPGNPDDDFDSSSNSSSDFEGGRGPPSETSDVMDERARIDRDFRKLPYAAQRDKLGVFMSRDDDWGEPDTDVDDDDGAGEGAPYATYQEAMRAKPDEYAGLYDYWLWEKKHNRKAPPVLKRDAKPWCPWIPAYLSVDDGEEGDWGEAPMGEDDDGINNEFSYQVYDEHYLNKYMVGSLFDNTAVGETTIAVGEGDKAGAEVEVEAEGDGGQEQQQEQSSSKSSLFSGSGPSFSSDSQEGQQQQSGQEQHEDEEAQQEVVDNDPEFGDDSLLEISNAGDASTPKKKLPRKSLQWSPDVSFDDGTFDLTDAGDASTPKKSLKSPTMFPNTRRRLSQGISKKTPTRTPRKTAPVVIPTPSPLRRLAWPVYTLSSTVSSAFTGLAGWGRGPSHLSVVANVEEVEEDDAHEGIANEQFVGNDVDNGDFDDAEMPDADVQEDDVDIDFGIDEDDQFVFSAFKVRMQPEATLTQRLVQLAYRSIKTFEARGALEEGDDEQGAIVVVANHEGTIIDDTGGRFDRTTLEDHAYGDSFVDTTIHRSSTFNATQVHMSDDEVDEFDAGGDPNASVSLNLDGDVDRYDDVLKRLRVEAVPAPWAPKPKAKKVGPQNPQKSAQVEEDEHLEAGGEVDDASDPNVSASLNLDDVLERLRVEAVPAPWAPKPKAKTKKVAPQTPQKSSQQDDEEFQVEEQAEGEVEADDVTDTNYVYDGTEDYTEEEEYEEDGEEFTVNDGVENVQSFVFAHEADNNVVDDSQMFDEQDHADNDGDVDKYDDVFVNGPVPKSAIPLSKPAAKPVNKLIEALRAGRRSSLKQSPKQSPKTKTAGAKTPLATVTAPEKTPPSDQNQAAGTQTSAAPRRVIHHNLNRHDLDSAINRVSAMRNDLADVMSDYDNLILDKKDFMTSLEAIYLTFDGLEKNLQYWKAGVGN